MYVYISFVFRDVSHSSLGCLFLNVYIQGSLCHLSLNMYCKKKLLMCYSHTSLHLELCVFLYIFKAEYLTVCFGEPSELFSCRTSHITFPPHNKRSVLPGRSSASPIYVLPGVLVPTLLYL